jgi:hypothetical protein
VLDTYRRQQQPHQQRRDIVNVGIGHEPRVQVRHRHDVRNGDRLDVANAHQQPDKYTAHACRPIVQHHLQPRQHYLHCGMRVRAVPDQMVKPFDYGHAHARGGSVAGELKPERHKFGYLEKD